MPIEEQNFDLVLSGGTLILSSGPTVGDLGISAGRITALAGPGEITGPRVYSIPGLLVFPGAVDPHVHLEQLTASGHTSSDDFFSGSAAGLYGGVTTLGDFAYPNPNERLVEAWERRQRDLHDRCLSRCFLHQAFGGNAPDLDLQVEEVIAAGARSFKLHMNDPRVDPDFIEKVCRLVARPGCLLLVHAEQGALIQNNIRSARQAQSLGLDSLPTCQPDKLEAAAITQITKAAARYGTRIYIVHLTSAAGLDAIEQARAEKVEVFAETCPQYLLLTAEKYRESDGHCYTCTPPFRTDKDREALWQALLRGKIQVIATDHCPFTREQKDTWKGDFTKIPYGMPGVETMVPLLISEGRKKGMSFELLSEVLSLNAARIYDLETSPGLSLGAPADLMVYELDSPWMISPDLLHMNCDFSPYRDWTLSGQVRMTFMGGQLWPQDFAV